MPGAQCTRSLACESSGWNAREYQRVHRKRPAFPHAMALRLIRDLPGDRAFLSPSPRENWCVRPVGLAQPPQDLTPASRRQDHTISPYAIRLRQRLRPAWYRSGDLWRIRKTASFVSMPIAAHRSCDPPCDSLHARRCRVHRIPHPTSVTIAIRPSLGTGWM
jgi:hypothetical protein